MHQAKKGNQYYFGAKAHIGADEDSGLVYSVVDTAVNVADVTQVDKLLHGEENVVCADTGYTGVEKRASSLSDLIAVFQDNLGTAQPMPPYEPLSPDRPQD